MRKLLVVVLLFIAVVLQSQDIKLDMTTSQVKNILGEPSTSNISTNSDTTVKTVYIYSEDLNYYYMAFCNDTLVEINPHPSYGYYESKNKLPENYYKLDSYNNIDTSLSLNSGNIKNTKSFGQKCLPFKPRETQILIKWFFK